MLAVIAGSGMASVADAVACERVVRFDEIDGVGACTVYGHSGEVREGTLEGMPCLMVVGRRHVYERETTAMTRLIAWLFARGATHLLVTSAAGGLRHTLEPGELLVAHDLIDRQNRGLLGGGRSTGNARNPLRLDPSLRTAVERAATRAAVPWHRGILVCGSGPAYETSAEVRALQEADGSVATMSAAPEVAAANALGLPVAVAALITNPGTGISATALSHDEVLQVGREAAGRVAGLVRQLIVEL